MPEQQPAGKDLDECVARVLGFEQLVYGAWVVWCKDVSNPAPGQACAYGVTDVPAYSTDPAVAVAALEEIRARGWLATLNQWEDGWSCFLEELCEAGNGRDLSAQGDTLQEAVARCIAQIGQESAP